MMRLLLGLINKPLDDHRHEARRLAATPQCRRRGRCQTPLGRIAGFE
jgi:hypothetical protein